MSGKKTKDYRYWLTHLFDELSVGQTFKPGLLHITLLPWFVLETDEVELIESFHRHFLKNKRFSVEVGEQREFGPKKAVPVSLVLAKPDILSLHRSALDWFGLLDARWAVKNPHAGEDYIPHIRRRPGTKIKQGDIIKVDSLTLARGRRREDGIRQVAAKVRFHEKS